MKLSLDRSKVSFSFPDPPSAATAPSYSFYEYHWDGPRRRNVPVWQPRQTTLFIVFDGASRHLFSTARIVLYYSNPAPKSVQASPLGDVWDIQQLGPVIHKFRGQVANPHRNASTLPVLTIAFEVAVGRASSNSSAGILVLRSPASFKELRRNAITVLLEHELRLTSDTLSLSLSFTHSTLLCTPIITPRISEQHVHPTSRIELVTTRIVRVLLPIATRTKDTNGRLPTEILGKIFKDAEFRYTWHEDLLSFAQVCRSWSCAMDVLHGRLHFSDNNKRSRWRPILDVYALAKALHEKPFLARGFRHFTTDNFGGKEDGEGDDDDDPPLCTHRNPAEFTSALISILATTKKVQYLHLGQLDPAQTSAIFGVLHDLDGLRTFSIGPIAEERLTALGGLIQAGPTGGGANCPRPPRLLSVAQLARCLSRWPRLTSLKIHHLHPGLVPGFWRVALRPPACALTQLTLARSHITDRDLAHLFSVAGRTVERLVLDRIEGMSNAGLAAFLRIVAPSVVALTVRDVALPPAHAQGNLVIGRMERALDTIVHAMPRLRELRIGGDVASEFMLDRRSRVYIAHRNNVVWKRIPIVQLWVEEVPRLCGFTADASWPGWSTPGKALRC